MKKKSTKSRVHPLRRATDHPAPFGSELWQHVEFIKRQRLARHSWVSIARRLESEHGVKIAPPSLYNFMKRYALRAKKGTLPLGFEPLPGASPLSPTPASPVSTPATTLSPDPAQQRVAIEALRAKAKQKPPEPDPNWDFAPDLNKPL